MEKQYMIASNVWSTRFMAAAIIQGAAIVVLTTVMVLGQTSLMKPEVSRVIAAGEQAPGSRLAFSSTS